MVIGLNLLVDTALPTVTINTVAGDNVINAAEVAAGQTISGTVANAEAGNTLTVTIGGNSYTATVQSDLSWSVSVPSDVLTALGNGSLSVSATVTNGHGNTGTGERDITIDANLPGLRVDTVAGDDVINTIEHNQNLIITGSSDGLTPGTALTVTVNGKDYSATVLADGTWSAAVPAADVSTWPEGTVKISVTGDSTAGFYGLIEINRPENAGAGRIKGVEVGGQTFFDFLPGLWSGFGVQANVTYLEGKQRYPANLFASNGGTTEAPFVPITGLSKWTYNVALFYEKGDVSTRLSFNNRDAFLNGNFINGDGFYNGEGTTRIQRLDFAFNYNLTKEITVAFDAANLLAKPFNNYRSYGNGLSYPRDVRDEGRYYHGMGIGGDGQRFAVVSRCGVGRLHQRCHKQQ